MDSVSNKTNQSASSSPNELPSSRSLSLPLESSLLSSLHRDSINDSSQTINFSHSQHQLDPNLLSSSSSVISSSHFHTDHEYDDSVNERAATIINPTFTSQLVPHNMLTQSSKQQQSQKQKRNHSTLSNIGAYEANTKSSNILYSTLSGNEFTSYHGAPPLSVTDISNTRTSPLHISDSIIHSITHPSTMESQSRISTSRDDLFALPFQDQRVGQNYTSPSSIPFQNMMHMNAHRIILLQQQLDLQRETLQNEIVERQKALEEHTRIIKEHLRLHQQQLELRAPQLASTSADMLSKINLLIGNTPNLLGKRFHKNTNMISGSAGNERDKHKYEEELDDDVDDDIDVDDTSEYGKRMKQNSSKEMVLSWTTHKKARRNRLPHVVAEQGTSSSGGNDNSITTIASSVDKGLSSSSYSLSSSLVTATDQIGSETLSPRIIEHGSSSTSSSSSSTSSGPKFWTPEEDEALVNAVNLYGQKKWKLISTMVANRNPTQCQQRWTKVLMPGLRKGPWSAEEDKLLTKLTLEQLNVLTGSSSTSSSLSMQGKRSRSVSSISSAASTSQSKVRVNWRAISDGIPGRTAKQCRARWINNLNPDLIKEKWSTDEDLKILEMYDQVGSKWSFIATHLKGRSENSVKTRCLSLLRTRSRNSGESSNLSSSPSESSSPLSQDDDEV